MVNEYRDKTKNQLVKEAEPSQGIDELRASKLKCQSGLKKTSIIIIFGGYVQYIFKWRKQKEEEIRAAYKELDQIFNTSADGMCTKEKGSGLGLAITYSIIKKHGGCVTVESKVGVGTTFHIYLPASEEEIFTEKEVEERLYLGKGEILFMDDQPELRNITCQMLSHIGYK